MEDTNSELNLWGKFIHIIATKGLPILIDFIKSAAISLIILLIIGWSLPKAPQVNSIVVNLYNHPHNLLILLLVAPIYAVMLAHYPSYFNIDSSHRSWYRSKSGSFLLSTVFYKYNPNFRDSERGAIEGSVNYLLRILGILFYIALFYMLFYTSKVNFDWKISAVFVSLGMVLIGGGLLSFLKTKKNNWLVDNFKYLYEGLPHFYDGDFSPSKETRAYINKHIHKLDAGRDDISTPTPATLMDVRKWVMHYCILLIFTTLLHMLLFALLFLSNDSLYTATNAIISLACIFFQMITFIYYRTFRSIFKFTFFNSKSKATLNAFYVLRVFKVMPEKHVPVITQSYIDTRRKKIIAFFKETDEEGKSINDFVQNSWLFKAFRWLHFGANSNNISFLQFTAAIGYVNLFFLILINYNSQLTLTWNINSMLIILSYFFFFYGVIVVLTKNFIYYKHSKEVYAHGFKNKYYGLIAICLVLLITANRLGRYYKNELFTLQPVKKESAISLDEFVENLNNTKNKTRYYIGAYGGGMKANAWTMTVLNELYHQDQDITSNFFDKVVGVSGVSGGTMGLINMMSIVHEKSNSAQWGSVINKVSTENILSLDLTHMLGRDLMSHMFVPFTDLSGKDRSSKAMEQYARLIHSNDNVKKVLKTPYRSYWKTIYKKRNNKFPILIANTTNVLGNHGMAVSVTTTPNSIHDNFLYQGADNILDINENKTLSYYNAASTSNRFPVLSPAAKIETLGHYNDGGIYENSGMLSVYKLFNAINHLEGTKERDSLQQRNVFINIVNDKNQYIKKAIKTFIQENKALQNDTLRIHTINNSKEIGAIIKSIASTEMLPIYVKTELKRLENAYPGKIEFKTIYLPHQFAFDDIENAFGGTLKLSSKSLEDTKKLLETYVKKNKETIQTLVLKNKDTANTIPIIEPPMSRVMSKEAYRFMLDMLDHPITKNTIKEVLD